MSTSGGTTLLWADGEYHFRLRIKELRELQDKCDAGPAEIMMRLATHRWRVDDILQAIRLGLIGGGMSPTEALVLVSRYVEQRPLAENVVIATEIIAAAVSGDPREPESKKAEATEGATAEFPSPPSTEPAPSSAGPLGRSIN
jgi:Phage tail tube protein, GTA-gp10